ncbi:MAG TPA: hypothetical protein VM432_13495 [Bdellovibrionales bacterium]|nr:hypothetical protein [Bdellovibrionales bacterium]
MIRKFLIAACCGLSLSACATYQTKVDQARTSLKENPTKAAESLKPLAEAEGKDQLVYLLDYATALQLAKQYQESAAAFQKAEQIADIKDYHSISQIATAAVLSEEMIQYKGDDYEKVLINGMNAINYLEMGDLDGALVEVRRFNEKLNKFRLEAKRNYAQNPYALYLSAMIYEADRKYDDAYIAYENTYKVAPSYTPLREDLVRSATRAQRDETAAKWKKEFPEVKAKPEWKDKNIGEVILVYAQGWGPRKRARPENFRFPKLYPVGSLTKSAKLVVSNQNISQALEDDKSATSEEVFNLTDTAIKTLDDDYGRLIASRVGGFATKAVIADQIRQKDDALGMLALIALNAADRADVRQWSTLPDTFQIARVYVKPGTYKVKAQGLNSSGLPSGEDMPEREITVKPGQKIFMSWRSLN